VNVDNSVNEHLVHVGARVEPELAEAVAQLAREGDRSLAVRSDVPSRGTLHNTFRALSLLLERPETDERRGLVAPAPDWFRWPERDLTPEDIERFEKLQRLEREGDQALR
jgi:hypothetical protein